MKKVLTFDQITAERRRLAFAFDLQLVEGRNGKGFMVGSDMPGSAAAAATYNALADGHAAAPRR